MSLDPRWASTIFAVYYFAGLFVSALAAMILLVIWLQRRSPLRAVVTENHLHDLGTLLLHSAASGCTRGFASTC
jgi:hypothetical protein